jgi:hypothetical protein
MIGRPTIDVMGYLGPIGMLILVLLIFIGGCVSSITDTCTVASELAECTPPTECCGGSCIQGCTDPGVKQIFPYTLRGVGGEIQSRMFTGVNKYTACIGTTVQDEFRLACEQRFFMSTTKKEIFLDEKNTTLLKLEDPYQGRFLLDLLSNMRSRTDNADDQVRLSVSLVQHIAYDTVKQQEFLQGEYSPNRLPYQVLYENSGICNEKAKLLAYFLKELGYGVALLRYPEEKHMAVGILAPEGYRTPGCGDYAYIESTLPAIISQVNQDIRSNPDIIVLAEGKEFGSIGEEYGDARELEQLLARKKGLTREEYNRARALAQKYDLGIVFR